MAVLFIPRAGLKVQLQARKTVLYFRRVSERERGYVGPKNFVEIDLGAVPFSNHELVYEIMRQRIKG